jgi:Tfp pilus assembly protein PilV
MEKDLEKKKDGFSVVEALVAISVLTAVIAGVFSTVQTSLSQATLSKDEVKAFYLAQEAFEIIRNIRDTNRLEILFGNSSLPWLYGIPSACVNGDICRVDAKSMSVISCGSASWGNCMNLRQDLSPSSPTYMLYGYDAGFTPTNFKREVYIQETVSEREMSVIVRVTWSKGLISKSFQTRSYFMKWR